MDSLLIDVGGVLGALVFVFAFYTMVGVFYSIIPGPLAEGYVVDSAYVFLLCDKIDENMYYTCTEPAPTPI